MVQDWRAGIEGGRCLRLMRGEGSELALGGRAVQNLHLAECRKKGWQGWSRESTCLMMHEDISKSSRLGIAINDVTPGSRDEENSSHQESFARVCVFVLSRDLDISTSRF